MVRLDARLLSRGGAPDTVRSLLNCRDHRRLDHDPAAPVFFYSQPQNLHIRVLAGDEQPRTNSVTIGGVKPFSPSSGSSAPTAASSESVAQWKRRGLGERLHGARRLTTATYGEAGRWAHAFYVAPRSRGFLSSFMLVLAGWQRRARMRSRCRPT
jgi:hypothetical protein